MAEQPSSTGGDTGNGSTLTVHGQEQRIAKIFKQRISTLPKIMAAKRVEIGQLTMATEVMVARINDEKNPLSAEEFGKISNSANITGLLAIAKSLEYMCDCLSFDMTGKVKGTNKIAHFRYTLADTLTNMAGMMQELTGTEDEDGILDDLSGMLNDIGNYFKCFKNKDGLHDPKKYLVEVEESAKPEKEVEEHEGLTEEEIEEIKQSKK